MQPPGIPEHALVDVCAECSDDSFRRAKIHVRNKKREDVVRIFSPLVTFRSPPIDHLVKSHALFSHGNQENPELAHHHLGNRLSGHWARVQGRKSASEELTRHETSAGITPVNADRHWFVWLPTAIPCRSLPDAPSTRVASADDAVKAAFEVFAYLTRNHVFGALYIFHSDKITEWLGRPHFHR